MALRIDSRLTAKSLRSRAERVFELSAGKIVSLEEGWDASKGTPVFTVRGRYTSRGWTEWTQGFQYGSALLQFDATNDRYFLGLGRRHTIDRMATHVSHTGVHDHGFNNISTYGNLWRLAREGKIECSAEEISFYELALKISGAVQASRWTDIAEGLGYIYSFNGPHSLFVDTIRSLRSLAVAHQLGHVLMGERDRKISLLQRLLQHARVTARFNIYYGEGQDMYDLPGRTAHEAIFNVNDGSFRCSSTQQGYSPFSTWTRGLAWALLGFSEQLEFLRTRPAQEVAGENTSAPGQAQKRKDPRESVTQTLLRAANATAEFYIANSCADGIPMWDTGAPNLHRLGDYLSKRADPFNRWEPVDSSAAAIAAQGFLRLGNYLLDSERTAGKRYRQAAFTMAKALFEEPYLSAKPRHQGLLLHSVYHRPNGWDYVAPGRRIPNGESSMWGDYHLRELSLLLLREAAQQPYPAFFAGWRPKGRLT